jgi:hypothetical protein
MKRANTRKGRDEELLDGLLKLDATKFEVWQFFRIVPINSLNNCGPQERGFSQSSVPYLLFLLPRILLWSVRST